MKREEESSFKENLVLWITGFIILSLVLVFIIRDKNKDVPLEEYEYIKNIKVQLEDIKNKKSTNLVLKNYSLNMDNYILTHYIFFLSLYFPYICTNSL